MRKLITTTITLILALVLTMTLAACAGSENDVSPGNSSLTGDISTHSADRETPTPDSSIPETTTPDNTISETPTQQPGNSIPESPVEDFFYYYDERLGGVVIKHYCGTSENVRIPAIIEGEPVVSVLSSGFDTIKELQLPDTVMSVFIASLNELTIVYKGTSYVGDI